MHKLRLFDGIFTSIDIYKMLFISITIYKMMLIGSKGCIGMQ